jgi:putative SOS response-associated peptidase YedK
MCGRFALITPPARLARYFGATLDEEVDPQGSPSWNVAPTDQVLGLTARHDGADGELTRTLRAYRWGLIPSWAKDAASGSRLFNARGETVSTRPSFREAFKARRIIVPADGFYEWRKQHSGSKQPHYFTRTDGEPMALAGVAEWWRDKQGPNAPAIHSCSIITTTASQDMDGIHDRMPVVLSPDVFDIWLDPEAEDVNELMALVRAAPVGTVTHHAVSQRVGSVRNNDPELIAPIEKGRTAQGAGDGPATLF